VLSVSPGVRPLTKEGKKEKKKTIHLEFLGAVDYSVKHGDTHARFLFP